MYQPSVDTSPRVSDEIRQTTCYMCACRCGINVHVQDGQVKYIEGNKDHPVNQGVLCAKGSAGIMQHLSPARLRTPLKRVGPRGSGEFAEIGWEEALELAVSWLKPLRETAPERLAFFTGRDQSQSFTGLWAQAFGTPNYAAHGGFCSVNMAAAGIYTLGGSFWEFGQPDWERTKLLLLFGLAEDHDSNPIKMGLGRLKARGAKIIGVNPVRTGYNAIADEWVGITPGSDGLFLLSLIRELIQAGKIDLDYLRSFTNAPCLLDPETGLFVKDSAGKFLVRDRRTDRAVPFDDPSANIDLSGTVEIDGKVCSSVFQKMVKTYLVDDYRPENVAGRCGIAAARIRGIAHELARVAFNEAIEIDQPWTDFRGVQHDKMVGRPVSFHAMRGISAHSNGFQTCRALHVLQILLGSVEVPGGFRFKPPYPKPYTVHPKPQATASPGQPLAGPHLGYPCGPEDLCVDAQGRAQRLDKAFTWEHPLAVHGMMHLVISNARAGDPYKIDTLFLYMANLAWNSSMNTQAVIDMLTDKDPETGAYVIPRFIYADSYSSETVAYADLILPDTTYLERYDCISLLDRPICEADAAADSIRWPVVEPDRAVRGFQSVLVDLGARLDLAPFVKEDGTPRYEDYADYMVHHERKPGIGPLAGFRGKQGDQAGRGAVNPKQLEAYKANGGFWVSPIPEEAHYFKPWNQAYQTWAVDLGLLDAPAPYLFEIYSEPLRKFQYAAEGKGDHQPPDHLRARIKAAMTPLPSWWPTFDQTDSATDEFPLHALTQRPAAMYHSWGSQNAWLRQIHGCNPLYVPLSIWQAEGFEDGDWAEVRSPHGAITVPVALNAALNERTVWTWNAIGKRGGAWALDPQAPEVTRGFLLNHLIHELLPPKGDGLRWANADPVTGQAAWYDLRVSVRKTAPPTDLRTRPDLGRQKSPLPAPEAQLRYGAQFP